MKTAKTKIDVAVKEYIRLFPAEYEAFKKTNAHTIDSKQSKWADIKGDHAVKRHLYDLPEKLHHAITQTLTSVEQDWFQAKGEFLGNFSGVEWFLKNYPIFKVTKDF